MSLTSVPDSVDCHGRIRMVYRLKDWYSDGAISNC